MSDHSSLHRLTAEAIAAGLSVRRIGRSIRVFDELDSTNNYVLTKLAIEEGTAADGCVVFAEHQTAGRGRLGRTWVSPRGAGLAMTVLLCEPDLRLLPARLIMSAAIGVAAGIADSADVEPVIRWPNDIYVSGKKVSGILVEVRSLPRGGFAVAVGIGVNCLQQQGHLPPELRDKATSLEIESLHPVDRVKTAQSILRHLDELLAGPVRLGDEQLANLWQSRSGDLGQQVTLVSDGESFTGRILDIHPKSGLLLQMDSGGRKSFDPSTTSRI